MSANVIPSTSTFQVLDDYRSYEKFEFSLTLSGFNAPSSLPSTVQNEQEVSKPFSQWIRVDDLYLRIRLVKISNKATPSSILPTVTFEIEVLPINLITTKTEYVFQLELNRRGRTFLSNRSKTASFEVLSPSTHHCNSVLIRPRSPTISPPFHRNEERGNIIKVTFNVEYGYRTAFEMSPLLIKVHMWKYHQQQSFDGDENGVEPHVLYPTRNDVTIAKEIQYLWSDRSTADCRLNVRFSDGDQGIPVHSFLLTLRSPVFRQMFQMTMKETETGTITIDDISIVAVEAMVEYLYKDTVSMISLKQDAYGLFVLAHRYEIIGLMEMVIHYLTSTLSPSNAIKILQLSSLYELYHLKELALEMVRTHTKQALDEGGFMVIDPPNKTVTDISYSEILLNQLGAKLMDEVLFNK